MSWALPSPTPSGLADRRETVFVVHYGNPTFPQPRSSVRLAAGGRAAGGEREETEGECSLSGDGDEG